MSSKRHRSRGPDLAALLEQLTAQYATLADLIQRKLAAMRRADVHAMGEIQEEETALAHRLHERNGLRRQLMGLIGQELGLTDADGRRLSLEDLTGRLSDPLRGRLLAAGEALRAAMGRAAQANRVTATTTREVLNHMQWVAAAIRPRSERPAGYAADGVSVTGANTLLIDTTG